MKYLLISLISLMLIITTLFCYKEGVILRLSNGSVESTTKYFSTKWIINLLLFIICLVSIVFYYQNIKFSALIFFSFFLVWFLSGRTIGVNYTGELSVGWFYVENEKISLWRQNACEGNIINETGFKVKFPGTLTYKNSCVSGKLFVGPFIISDLDKKIKDSL